jgi:transglutaminase-like putative cysteine protease
MRLTIEHQTQYVYSEPVMYTIQQLRLTPQNGLGQYVKHWSIKVNGHLHEFEDCFGNESHTLVIDQPHQSLLISVSGEVETGVDRLMTKQTLPLPIYLRETPLTEASEEMIAFARSFANKPLQAMMHAIRETIAFSAESKIMDTTAVQAFKLKQGICQDYSHVFISCCRVLEIPARYVSGYLFTDGGTLMHTHSWAEVWENDTWLGFDVCHDAMVDDAYVRLATGLDYRSACPVTGARVGGGEEGMASMVSVNNKGKITLAERKSNSAALLEAALAMQEQTQVQA